MSIRCSETVTNVFNKKREKSTHTYRLKKRQDDVNSGKINGLLQQGTIFGKQHVPGIFEQTYLMFCAICQRLVSLHKS